MASDNLPYSVRVESGATEPLIVNEFISIPLLPQMIRLLITEGDRACHSGSSLKVAIKGYNLRNIEEAEFMLKFPTDLMRGSRRPAGGESGAALAPMSALLEGTIPMEVEQQPAQGTMQVKLRGLSQ